MLVTAFAGYWPILDNYWFLDDTSAPFAGYVLSLDITKLFTYRFDVIYMTPVWRIVVALSYLPNYLLSGLDPWSYYLVSIFLHAGNGFMAFLISRKLLNSVEAALLVSLLFAVSLNKADAVMMIAHRTTLLGALFALMAFYCYVCLIVDGFSKTRLIACLLALLAALGSYETAIVMPGVFLAFGLVWRGTPFFRSREFAFGLVLAVVGVLLILWLDLGAASEIVKETSFMGRLFHMARNILAVLPTFVIPPFLLQSANITYYSQGTGFGWIEISGVVLLLVLLVAGLMTRERTVLAGIIFFLVVALPTSKVPWLFYPDISLADYHRMRWSVGKFSYLSSFGVYLAGGVLLWRVYVWLKEKSPGWLTVRLVASAALMGYLSFNMYWIYQREKAWEYLTNGPRSSRKQIESLRALNLALDPEMLVYHYGFSYYFKHIEALFRVVFKNPNLVVRYGPSDYDEMNKNEKAIFVIANDSGSVDVYRDAYGNRRYP